MSRRGPHGAHRSEPFGPLQNQRGAGAPHHRVPAQHHLDRASLLASRGEDARWPRGHRGVLRGHHCLADHRRRRIELVEQPGVRQPTRAGHGAFDAGGQRVQRSKEQLELVSRRGRGPPAQRVQQVLQPVRQVGDPGVAHRGRHALHRVDGAEQPADLAGRGGLALPLEQQPVAGAQMLPALGQEKGGVLREVHAVSPGRAAPPRARGRAGMA